MADARARVVEGIPGAYPTRLSELGYCAAFIRPTKLAPRVEYERQFLEALGLIAQIVRFIGRRHHLAEEELEELSSSVRLKLIDNDYEVLRRFEGRSSLKTYLTAVVTRHFLDARIARWGKWRPSAQARRLGPTAILLDRLVNRDGYSFAEAAEILRTNHHAPVTDRELLRIEAELPRRSGRRFVGEEFLEQLPATSPSPEVTLPSERHAEEGAVEDSLAAAIDALPSSDRMLLKLRFREGLTVAEVARLMRLDAKPLYRRLEQLMVRLRRELEGRGVHAERVFKLLDQADAELAAPWGTDSGEIRPASPSNA